MLSVGDLLWVPFTYSYTAYYLALHPKDIGVAGCAGVLAVQLLGYWIFRSSNNEKNESRLGRNPKSESLVLRGPGIRIRVLTDRSLGFALVADLQSFQTERGTRLLTSGWWGRSRHPN